jgi:diguanylate cyclase (GGDEF)-like protein
VKRKILIAMLLLFACATAGSALALVYVRSTTEELRRVSQLHRIEQMRKHLVFAVQDAETDLLTANGSRRQVDDRLRDNALAIEQAAAACTGCHHPSPLEAQLRGIQALVGEYRKALDASLVASGDHERTTRLRAAAAGPAAQLLRATEQLASLAAHRAGEHAAEAMVRFDEARKLLTATVVLSLLVAVGIAVRLATSIIRPVQALVRATRALQAGQLGVTLDLRDKTELGELARHFDAMSTALRAGYARLQGEIDDRKRAEQRLLYDAFHDALTGLPNRGLFLDRLQHVIESGRRHPEQLYAVLFLDLDRFKVVNDTLGHLVGDQLLVAVGQRIADCLRPGDTVARLGGDEFGILLDRLVGPADATQVADRILRSLGRPVVVDGHEVFATCSIGIALRSERYQRPEQVLRDADIAMYQAKQRGKACSEVFDAVMHGSVVERLQLEADLRRAVDRGEEFLLHYQPVVALRTGRVVVIEALLRWAKPGRGLLDAAEFVPLAEEAGVMAELGDWVFEAAFAQIKAWQERAPALGAVIVSINVSGGQFRRPEFVDDLRRIVRAAGVDPRAVALEVTEATIMGDVESSTAKLALLRELGVQIHIDDFGTGYSSLSYLHRFPITAVKIDRSFVAGLPVTGAPGQVESEEVIKAIVSIGESLDFDVIAEGVETSGQREKLQDLRCRYGQGIGIAKPMSGPDLEAWAAGPRALNVA